MGKRTDLESVHLVNHSKCMLAAFHNFRQDSTMLDVTLACNGQSLKAHKLLLSACSPFFRDLFAENPCPHPIIILRDFDFADLKAVIDFIYKGELSVPRERLMSTLKVAEELHVRGLRRSEPSTARYETLFNQVCGKSGSRRKRKKLSQNSDSSDSDAKQYVKVPDSDDNMESDTSVQRLDFISESSIVDQDTRPLVLRVADQSISNEDASKALSEKEVRNMDENAQAAIQDPNIVEKDYKMSEAEVLDPLTDIKSSTSLDVEVSSETSNNLIESVPVDEYSQGDLIIDSSNQKTYPMEQVSSNSHTFPELAKCNSSAVCDDGKNYACSKCDAVFTSRLTFMRHKMEGHKTLDKSFKCQQCPYSTNDLLSLKNHELKHATTMSYTCSICMEEFNAREIYEKHLADHEVSDSSSCSLQSLDVKKLYIFRCSVCFEKFSSKLSCQLHEKSCQGKF